MVPQDEKTQDEPRLKPGTGLLSGGAMAMVVVCCGGHALLVGVLGGVALGSVLGIGAGVLTAVVLVVGIIVLRRRRTDACGVPLEARSSR